MSEPAATGAADDPAFKKRGRAEHRPASWIRRIWRAVMGGTDA